MSTLQFNLSEDASRKVDEFTYANALPAETPLRIDIIGGAESGYAYNFYFDQPKESDIMIEVGHHKLLFSPDAASYLDGSTLDWVVSDNGSGFCIYNPNEPIKT